MKYITSLLLSLVCTGVLFGQPKGLTGTWTSKSGSDPKATLRISQMADRFVITQEWTIKASGQKFTVSGENNQGTLLADAGGPVPAGLPGKMEYALKDGTLELTIPDGPLAGKYVLVRPATAQPTVAPTARAPATARPAPVAARPAVQKAAPLPPAPAGKISKDLHGEWVTGPGARMKAAVTIQDGFMTELTVSQVWQGGGNAVINTGMDYAFERNGNRGTLICKEDAEDLRGLPERMSFEISPDKLILEISSGDYAGRHELARKSTAR